jgi:hypothetical protein
MRKTTMGRCFRSETGTQRTINTSKAPFAVQAAPQRGHKALRCISSTFTIPLKAFAYRVLSGTYLRGLALQTEFLVSSFSACGTRAHHVL